MPEGEKIITYFLTGKFSKLQENAQPNFFVVVDSFLEEIKKNKKPVEEDKRIEKIVKVVDFFSMGENLKKLQVKVQTAFFGLSWGLIEVNKGVAAAKRVVSYFSTEENLKILDKDALQNFLGLFEEIVSRKDFLKDADNQKVMVAADAVVKYFSIAGNGKVFEEKGQEQASKLFGFLKDIVAKRELQGITPEEQKEDDPLVKKVQDLQQSLINLKTQLDGLASQLKAVAGALIAK